MDDSKVKTVLEGLVKGDRSLRQQQTSMNSCIISFQSIYICSSQTSIRLALQKF